MYSIRESILGQYLYCMVQLSNERISVSIHPDGAELRSLTHNVNGRQYLWSGDPAYWGKYSPVLFPFVGSLKDGRYTYEGKSYPMGRHGFARDKTFEAEVVDHREARFSLEDDESTRAVYPFSFRLTITYQLRGPILGVTYKVYNPGDGIMWFCIGAHPAFAVPNAPVLSYDDYFLDFNESEVLERWELEGGLLKKVSSPFLDGRSRILLSKDLFAKDAIVLKGLRSSTITVATTYDTHGFRFNMEGWPYLGLWAASGADFLCIEPWQGHADHVDDPYDITQKEGVVALESGRSWSRNWWVELF